jgi:hypothetical protein
MINQFQTSSMNFFFGAGADEVPEPAVAVPLPEEDAAG